MRRKELKIIQISTWETGEDGVHELSWNPEAGLSTQQNSELDNRA